MKNLQRIANVIANTSSLGNILMFTCLMPLKLLYLFLNLKALDYLAAYLTSSKMHSSPFRHLYKFLQKVGNVYLKPLTILANSL